MSDENSSVGQFALDHANERPEPEACAPVLARGVALSVLVFHEDEDDDRVDATAR